MRRSPKILELDSPDSQNIVECAAKSMALVPGDKAVRLEAEALRGLGLGLMGRLPDGIRAHKLVLTAMPGNHGLIAERTRIARAWLQV